NAPFSEPNSSFSRSACGMAAQLMATNGLSFRGDNMWHIIISNIYMSIKCVDFMT
ncbi:unnamed protein product, partial [marine sediment metagenome]